MRIPLAFLPFTVMTLCCWGIYGPVLHHGQHEMGDSSFRQLICVGIAYFFIAVVAPIAILATRGESGHWTVRGFIWSLLAGACGALGALGIISALNADGKALYVMPLVFGGAPVVNTFASMWMAKTFKEAGPLFYAGVILVVLGAAGVLIFKPSTQEFNLWNLQLWQVVTIIGSISLTVLCWGFYGSVLHKGQALMAGSRLRPLLCVGLSYFAIAVIIPMLVLSSSPPEASWQWSGAFWSLGAGACGAIGALGIIMSFNFGGKPIFVMPLVFGGAPVVNTFVSIWEKNVIDKVGPLFYAALILVISGAVVVLIFAPRPSPPSKDKKNKRESKQKGSTKHKDDEKHDMSGKSKATTAE